MHDVCLMCPSPHPPPPLTPAKPTIRPHDREKIMSEIELNSKRAGLHGFETVKVRV